MERLNSIQTRKQSPFALPSSPKWLNSCTKLKDDVTELPLLKNAIVPVGVPKGNTGFDRHCFFHSLLPLSK
jgi:hypothetical protein